MSIQVQVPGKMILLGEYAVLEGARALVMAVNRYVKVSVKRRAATEDFQLLSNLSQSPFHFVIDKSGKILSHPAETGSGKK